MARLHLILPGKVEVELEDDTKDALYLAKLAKKLVGDVSPPSRAIGLGFGIQTELSDRKINDDVSREEATCGIASRREKPCVAGITCE